MKNRTRVQFEEQPLHPCIRALLAVGGLIAVLFFVFGCAGPQLTPEQVTQINIECNDDATCIIEATDKAMVELVQRLEHERADKLLVRFDKQINMLNICDQAAGYLIWETRRSIKRVLPTKREMRKAKRAVGYSFTHENVDPRVSRADWSCMHVDDVELVFKRLL